MNIPVARANYLAVLKYAIHTVEHKHDFSHGDVIEDIEEAYNNFKEAVENGVRDENKEND